MRVARRAPELLINGVRSSSCVPSIFTPCHHHIGDAELLRVVDPSSPTPSAVTGHSDDLRSRADKRTCRVYPVCEFVGVPPVAKETYRVRSARHRHARTAAGADGHIDPNTSLPGINQLRTIVGAVMTIGLILSVLALIVSAIVWGFGANSSNPHLASRGKIGVVVACGAAVICGASVTLINFFWNVGQSV